MTLSKREPLVLRFNQHIDDFSTFAVPLEDGCTDCGGTGEKKEEDRYDRYNKTCFYCEGSGVVLNDNGRAIIQLMSFYTKSKDSEVLLAQRNL